MDKSQRFGTTEISDPCFHLEIFENLYDGIYLMTKIRFLKDTRY